MTFKKSVLSLALAVTFASASFASTATITSDYSSPKTVSTEIQTMIKKLNLDFTKIDNSTINVKFMVNENNELVVISTGDSQLDQTIKSALNYKEVDTKGLKPYSVYIVPVKFEAK